MLKVLKKGSNESYELVTLVHAKFIMTYNQFTSPMNMFKIQSENNTNRLCINKIPVKFIKRFIFNIELSENWFDLSDWCCCF